LNFSYKASKLQINAQKGLTDLREIEAVSSGRELNNSFANSPIFFCCVYYRWTTAQFSESPPADGDGLNRHPLSKQS